MHPVYRVRTLNRKQLCARHNRYRINMVCLSIHSSWWKHTKCHNQMSVFSHETHTCLVKCMCLEWKPGSRRLSIGLRLQSCVELILFWRKVDNFGIEVNIHIPSWIWCEPFFFNRDAYYLHICAQTGWPKEFDSSNVIQFVTKWSLFSSILHFRRRKNKICLCAYKM